MPWTREEEIFCITYLETKAENPRSSRKLTARWPDDVDVVRDSVRWSPKKSIQRHSQKLGLSCTSLQRILKDFQLYPYRIQITYKHTPADREFLISVINPYYINGLYLCLRYLVFVLCCNIWYGAMLALVTLHE